MKACLCKLLAYDSQNNCTNARPSPCLIRVNSADSCPNAVVGLKADSCPDTAHSCPNHSCPDSTNCQRKYLFED